jgi:hypothetical protein
MGSSAFRRAWVTVLALCSLTLVFRTACIAEAPLDPAQCITPGKHVVLCFDLRNDSQPTADIAVRVDSADQKQCSIFLPFRTTLFKPDRSLLSTWGEFANFTLIRYSNENIGTFAMSLSPVFDTAEGALDEGGSTSALAFVRLGLERRFLYRNRPMTGPQPDHPITDRPDLVKIDAIGVARPEHVTGIELKNGRTEKPDAFVDNETVRFYPAADEKGEGSTVEVRYQLPPTKFQTLVLAYISKLAAAFAGPFVAIVFFTVKENVRPRTRRYVLLVLVVVQLLIFGWLTYTAWSTRTESAATAVLDWVVVAITAFGSALPLWLKRERPDQQLAVRV